MLALAVFLSTFFLLWGLFYRRQQDWRSAFLSGSIAWSALLVAITELLSVFHAIVLSAVLAAWAACFLIAVAIWFRLSPHSSASPRGNPLEGFSWVEWVLLCGCGLVVALLGLLAWVSPPNTYDALTYHMPRVMHWLQDRSLAFYPASILRQLYINPGSEFIILHFQVLAGSDRFANFVQWFSMIGSAVGVSLIARELGAGVRGQLFGLLAGLTIPMGILQASGTQTDYVTGFWLLCFTYWMISLKARGGFAAALAAGASLGLALLSKSTAYIFAFPILVWLSISVLVRYRARAAFLLGTVALMVIFINLGTYIRDQRLFGNPLGITPEPTVRTGYSSDVFSPAELASNILRNTALNLGTPSSKLNAKLTRGVRYLHTLIGISPDDRRTTWPGTQFKVPPIAYAEDSDGNLLHLVLVVLTIGVVLLQRDLRKRLWGYLLCLVCAYLLFCLLLKWQPWNSRLELPLFLLFMPLAGAAAEVLRPKWISNAAAALLLLAALPWVLQNHTRPLVGTQSVLRSDRMQLYFRAKPSAQNAYIGAVDFLATASNGQCRQVGLDLGGNDMEYPFWVLLQRDLGNDVTIKAVNVQNVSIAAEPEVSRFVPCAILAASPAPVTSLKVGTAEYSGSRTFGAITVLLPAR